MRESQKINLAGLIGNGNRIVIPDIQRDYVLGSGGKDKLKSLFDAMCSARRNEQDFGFSALITHYKDGVIYIYDGQQRITTLVVLYAYLCAKEGKTCELDENSFCFMGRDDANEVYKKLVRGEITDPSQVEVCDHTTYSIKNLLENYSGVNSDFIFNHVVFDEVQVESQSDVEQFYMDLNSGLKLKDYELYKSKLLSRVNKMNRPYKKDFISKFDNEWLEMFAVFADDKCPAEKVLVDFIKYCFNMMFIRTHGYADDNITEVTEQMKKVFEEEYDILGLTDGVFNTKIKTIYGMLCGMKNPKKVKSDKKAFCDLDEDIDVCINNIWESNLKFGFTSSPSFDRVRLWAYLKSYSLPDKARCYYLRAITVLLNNNIFTDRSAYQYIDNDGIAHVAYRRFKAYAYSKYSFIKENNDYLLAVLECISLMSTVQAKLETTEEIREYTVIDALIYAMQDYRKYCDEFNKNYPEEFTRFIDILEYYKVYALGLANNYASQLPDTFRFSYENYGLYPGEFAPEKICHVIPASCYVDDLTSIEWKCMGGTSACKLHNITFSVCLSFETDVFLMHRFPEGIIQDESLTATVKAYSDRLEEEQLKRVREDCRKGYKTTPFFFWRKEGNMLYALFLKRGDGKYYYSSQNKDNSHIIYRIENDRWNERKMKELWGDITFNVLFGDDYK